MIVTAIDGSEVGPGDNVEAVGGKEDTKPVKSRGQGHMKRRMSSVEHVPISQLSPKVSLMDDKLRTDLLVLCSKFSDPPNTVPLEAAHQSVVGALSNSTMKAVSSGWGAFRGFIGSRK